MKTFLKGIVFTSVWAMSTHGLMATQPSESWLDQWYKAKLGRYSPPTEARLRVERENSASREEASGLPARSNWIEQFYKAKYGLNTPAEEARLKAERDSSAFREEPVQTQSAKSWIDQWYKAKSGRYSPAEEVRLKAAGK